MKRSSTIFLQIVLVLVAVGAIALLLWEPHMEGRNVNATTFEIYFNDPFLAYAYLASIPFFAAFYQAFKVLEYVRNNKTFTQSTVKAFQAIKYCAMALIVFILGAEVYFFTVQRGKGEDIAGGVAMGLFMIFGSVIVATAAALCERLLQNAVDIKSENDLTV